MGQNLKSLAEKLLPDLSKFEVISIDQTKENIDGPFDMIRIQREFLLRSLDDPNFTLVIITDQLKEKELTDH